MDRVAPSSPLSWLTIRPPGGGEVEAHRTDRTRSVAKGRGDRSACDAPRRADRDPSARRSSDRDAGPPEQLLDGVLGGDGIDRQSGSELEAGDLTEPGMDLPVPVERGVDALAERRGVEDEVVGRSVE